MLFEACIHASIVEARRIARNNRRPFDCAPPARKRSDPPTLRILPLRLTLLKVLEAGHVEYRKLRPHNNYFDANTTCLRNRLLKSCRSRSISSASVSLNGSA